MELHILQQCYNLRCLHFILRSGISMLYFSLLNVLNTKLITHQLRFVLVYRYLAEQQQDDRLVMCNINVYAIKR